MALVVLPIICFGECGWHCGCSTSRVLSHTVMVTVVAVVVMVKLINDGCEKLWE
jgi:hypothetical protein